MDEGNDDDDDDEKQDHGSILLSHVGRSVEAKYPGPA